jgi:hypothetical protein
METTEEARQVIEAIQRERYLHPDDIAAREKDPNGQDTRRHEQTIKEFEDILELYAPDMVKQALILRRICKDLYSDLNHFILELIQNADDNEYHENTSPNLKFQLSRTQLVVECNEVGFTGENVRSICRINDSTKTGDKGVTDGYIGEKGIGKRSPKNCG